MQMIQYHQIVLKKACIWHNAVLSSGDPQKFPTELITSPMATNNINLKAKLLLKSSNAKKLAMINVAPKNENVEAITFNITNVSTCSCVYGISQYDNI
mmetsp:Transcript_76236/g.68357  ORF Transcript_76236/g.68357 Transcript_76236/m.68357 type:complete len:98 (+) Transcript_76236:263-556(+)